MKGQIELEDYLQSLEEHFNILDYIPTGSQNAIKRRDLVRMTGLCDRDVRDYIHFARRKIPIVNLSCGRGYFIPDMNTEWDRALLVRYVRQEERRLRSIGWALKAARQTLRNCGIDWRSYGKEKQREGKARRAGACERAS